MNKFPLSLQCSRKRSSSHSRPPHLIKSEIKMESISVYSRMQSSENSIYVGNSAIRTVTVHLANRRLFQSHIKISLRRAKRKNFSNLKGHYTKPSIYHVGNYSIWTLVTCQRHLPTVVCFTLIDQILTLLVFLEIFQVFFSFCNISI